MSKTSKMVCVFIGLLVLMAISADVSAAGLEKSGLKINVLAKGKISGSFTKGGRTIYFEAIRGEKNPRSDPDAPKYAIDVRIMDSNRITFVGQIGGHGLVDLEWKDEYQKFSDIPVNAEERAQDFLILPDLAKALKAYSRRHNGYKWELKTLISQATISESDLMDQEDAEREQIVAAAVARIYKHRIAICKKKVYNVVNFEHSAVRLKIYDYSSGKLLLDFSTSNHGTSAKDMSEKCSSTLLKYDTNVYIWDQACDCLGFPFRLTHVCNNDTKQEFLSQYNGGTRHWGYCTPQMLYAPNCN